MHLDAKALAQQSLYSLLPGTCSKKQPQDSLPLKCPDEAIKSNFVKSRPLSAHLCNIMCDKVESSHRALLLHSKIQSLS